MAIRFGTSGWRAIIGDEFTFENVRRATAAICKVLEDLESQSKTVVVGHDSRFLGEQFAATCVAELDRHGFEALLCTGPTPTPAISCAIRREKAAGGINFTASHNPPEYSGIKFSTSDGAPALPVVTDRIEAELTSISVLAPSNTPQRPAVSYDPKPGYIADLEGKIRFDVIAKARGRYAYDPLWGTGRGYLDEVLRKHGLSVETVHDWRDVLFGGHAPEPDPAHLGDLRTTMANNGCVLGLATDGDGDRFGVVDQDGTFITPNQLIALLFDYLIDSRGWNLGVARSVATSNLVDRVAKDRNLPVYETPVGFKFIGDLINNDRIALGGEESAGMSIRGHYPEKDGVLACLLAAEAVAARGASLSAQLEALFARVGRIESGRIGVRLTKEVAAALPEKLKQEPAEMGGRKIVDVSRVDGMKLTFADGSWLLLRPSGTEPIVRIYAEAESAKDLEVLLEQGKKFILA